MNPQSAQKPSDNDATPLVQAQGLEQVYRVGGGLFRKSMALQAVSGVGFSIAAGRTLAVVGESGCGKSTLARMVSLIEAPAAGQLLIGGEDAVRCGPAQRQRLRQQVQLVFQNPYGSLNPRKRIGQILEAPLEINRRQGATQRRALALEMLLKVGLRPEHYDRYPHMFSGGQRQRIAIARALMLQPALLVADEPVSALDVSVQAQILNVLADLQRDMGLAYLFISHDLGVVRHIAHDVMVMYLGHAVEQGEKNTIFERPLHPYTQALIASTPSVQFGAVRSAKRIVLKGELPSPLNPPKGCVFSTRCPLANVRCHQERPALQWVENRSVACHEAQNTASLIQPAAHAAFTTLKE
jgi:dipeptide transport system ATP-binding protein